MDKVEKSFIDDLIMKRARVTIVMNNGYQMCAVILSHGKRTLKVRAISAYGAQLIYKSNVSTIKPPNI